MTPIDALEHARHLRCRDRYHAIDGSRPDEPASLQALGVKRHPQRIVPQDLDQIATPAAEDIQIARVWIAMETLLHLHRQPVHPAPHIGVAGGDPDPDTARNRDHRASNRSAVDTSASGACAMICTRARPISITIAAAGATGVADAELS